MRKNKPQKMLCHEDFKGRKINPNWSALDMLAEVVAVATEKFEQEKLMRDGGNNQKDRIDDVNKQRRLTRKFSINKIPPGKSLIEKSLKKTITNPAESPDHMSKKERLMKEKALKKPATEEEEPVKLKRKDKDMPTGPDPPPDLPEEFKNVIAGMGGSDVKLVIQKRLFWTDVNPGHNRLSMPMSQIKAEFLTAEEKKVLNTQINSHWEEIEVRLIDPSLNEGTISLRKWPMKTSSSYVLVKTWNLIVSSNNLEEDDLVQLWSFRVGSELCFALVKVRREDNGSSGKSKTKRERNSKCKRGEDGSDCSNSGEDASTGQGKEIEE